MALNLDELFRRIFESSFIHPIQAEQISHCAIRLALERVYSNNQAWIVTDLFNDRSPFQKENEESSLAYVKEIERIIVEEENLTKPIVSVYKNETDSSWDLMVILPKRNILSRPKIFYRNSSQNSEIPFLIKFLLLNELSTTEDLQNIKGGLLKDAGFIAQPNFIAKSLLHQNEGGWWALLDIMLIIREENESNLNIIQSWVSVSLEINNFFRKNGIDLNLNDEQLSKTIDTDWIGIQKSLLLLNLNNKTSAWEINNTVSWKAYNTIEDRLETCNYIANASSCSSKSSCIEKIKNNSLTASIRSTKNFAYNNALQPNVKTKKNIDLIAGMPDYNNIIDDNSVIIDKTLFIKEVFESENYAILITRPRRWGKTSNMNMLRAFLHPKRDKNGDLVNETLFSAERNMLINESCSDLNPKKFAIATAKDGYYINKLAGKVPVIFITFEDIIFEQNKTLEAAIHKAFGEAIAKAFRDHLDVYNAKLERLNLKYQYKVQKDISIFEKYVYYDPDSDLKQSIPFLSDFLKNHYGERVCIIIDQYDAPYNKLLRGDKFEAVVKTMNVLLNRWIKRNIKNVKKVIMTGVLGNGSDYIFYDMKDFYSDNVLSSRYSKYFGFTEREVELLARQCLDWKTEKELKQYRKDIRSWYDGYSIGGIKIYNPYSIMSCLSASQVDTTQILKPYWVERENNLELIQLFNKFAHIEKITELLRTGYLKLNMQLESNVTFSNIDQQEIAFFSYLLHSGYLTSLPNLTKVNKSWNCTTYRFFYALPNKEVKNYVFNILFPSLLTKIRQNFPILNLNHLVNRLNANLENVQEYSRIIKSEVLNNWDYTNYKEIDFQMIPAGAWFFAKIANETQRHTLWNENINEYGYAPDALYIPIKDKSTTVVVHEYKKIFNAPMNSVYRKAVDTIIRIYDRYYMDPALYMYVKDHNWKYFTNVIIRGIVFYCTNNERRWNLKIIQHEHTVEEAVKISSYFKFKKKELLNCKTEEDLQELLNRIKLNEEGSRDEVKEKIGADLEDLHIDQDNSRKRKSYEYAKFTSLAHSLPDIIYFYIPLAKASNANIENDIIFAQTIKSNRDLAAISNLGVKYATFDCVEELRKIANFGLPNLKLVLRIFEIDEKAVLSFRHKFGAIKTDWINIFEEAVKLGIEIVGVSFNVGSRVKDTNAYFRAIRAADEVWNIGEQYGFNMHLLDIGGGFTFQNFENAAEEINRGINQYFSQRAVRIISEPGIFFAETIVSSCFSVVGKRSRVINGENKVDYFLSDGIIGTFSSLRFYSDIIPEPILLGKQREEGEKVRSTLYGPTCNGLDKIVECDFENAEIGDMVAFENMGAYNQALATDFNGIPMATNTKLYIFEQDSVAN